MIGIVKSNDKRINYLNNLFEKAIFSDRLEELVDIDILILPFQGIDRFGYIKGSNLLLEDIINNNNIKTIYTGISNDILEGIGNKHSINIRVLMDDVDFVNKNAILTAEGLIRVINNKTEDSLSNLKILLLGYGYVGGAITKLLNYYTKIDIFTINKDEAKKAILYGNRIVDTINDLNYDILINTIPTEIVKNISNKKILIFDVSSYPYGFGNDLIELVNVIPGIPGNILPVAASKIIYEKIIKEI